MKHFLILLLHALPLGLWAQQTGHFDKSIEFMGSTRLVSVYVPENYDPAKQYPMYLGLHGFNQSTYALRGALEPIAKAREAIIVCPSGNGNRHDDEFPGTENGAAITQEIVLVHTTLDSAQRWFSIDPTAVVLTGFSYGGREALYFGMQHYFKFRGIIGLSPAVQSLADINNNLPVPRPRPFAFEHQDKIPICMCAGEQDDFFIDIIKAMSNKLQDKAGADTLLLNPAGHTVFYPEFNDDFNSCLDFIDRNHVRSSTSISNGLRAQKAPAIRVATGSLWLAADANESYQLRIYSLSGALLLEKSIKGQGQVNTEALAKGNYIVQVLNAELCQSSMRYLP